MANCKLHLDRNPRLVSNMAAAASTMDNSNLKEVFDAQQEPDFLESRNPDQYAYLRRWQMAVRREARRRGLL